MGTPPATAALPPGQGPPQLPPPQGPAGQSVPGGMQSQLSTGQDLGVAPGDAEQMPVDIVQLAEGYAQQIATLDPEMQEQALAALEAQSPELAQLVSEMLPVVMQQMGVQSPDANAGVDMRPLPEQLPARRGAQLV